MGTEYVDKFKRVFTAEIGETLYARVYDQQKHFDVPMPDPEDLATEMAQWLAEKFIKETQ